ncbi:hypothetical protein ACLOAV_010739 [Pseudogymnoascus australis]
MACDSQITELETEVKHLQSKLQRAMEQIKQCDSCRLSLVTNNYQADNIYNSSELPPNELHYNDNIRNSSDLPSQSRHQPQGCHQADNIHNSSELPPEEPHDDNIRNSSELPPDEPHDDNIRNSSDIPSQSHHQPQGCHQADNIHNSSELPPEEPHDDNIRNSSELPSDEPHDDNIRNSSDIPSQSHHQPQGCHQADNIHNSSELPPEEPHDDNIRNSSELPSDEPHDDNIRNSSDIPSQSHHQPQGCHQADNIHNSSELPPEEPHDDNIRNSSDLPLEPLQRNSNDLLEPCRGNAINNSNATLGLQFKFYKPRPTEPTKTTKPTKPKRWKAHADELAKEIYTVKSITQYHDRYWEYRIRAILLGVSVCNGVTPSSSSSTAEESLRDFASITKFTEQVSDFTRQVHAFQQLIFASACSVLIAYGVQTSKVDSIMQLCVSNSKPDHLSRLRNGSQWVNKQTSKYCSLLQVCKKLNVPDSYVNKTTISLCRQYSAIRGEPGEECLLPSPESQKRTMDEQPASDRETKHRRGINEPSTSSTPTECHSGTEDTALVSPSEKEGSNNRTSPDDLQTNRHLSEETAFDGIGSLLEAAGIQKEPNRASQNQVRIDPTSPKHPTDRFSGHNIPHLPLEVYDDGRSLESCLGPEINVEKWDRILDSEQNSGNWVPFSDPEINVETNDENWDPPVLDPESNTENRVPLFGPEPELNGSWAPLDNNPAFDKMLQDHLYGPEPELNGSWAPLDNNPALDKMLQDHLYGPEPELNGSWAPLDNMLQDHLFGPEPELNGGWAPLDNNPALDNDHLFCPEPELNSRS